MHPFCHRLTFVRFYITLWEKNRNYYYYYSYYSITLLRSPRHIPSCRRGDAVTGLVLPLVLCPAYPVFRLGRNFRNFQQAFLTVYSGRLWLAFSCVLSSILSAYAWNIGFSHKNDFFLGELKGKEEESMRNNREYYKHECKSIVRSQMRGVFHLVTEPLLLWGPGENL
jgi:hypothetical protein